MNSGTISIKCKSFKNESNKINPKPFIQIIDNNNFNTKNQIFTKIHIPLLKINLHIKSQNGDINAKYLLDNNNVCYSSKPLCSINGNDCIIFSMQYPYLIKKIRIRNYEKTDAVKKISLLIVNY